MAVGQLAHVPDAPVELRTRAAHAGVQARLAHGALGQGVDEQARARRCVRGEFAQHLAHLRRLQVHQHALAQHEQGLRQRAPGQVQRLPPLGIAQVEHCLAQAWGAVRCQRAAQRHHLGQVGVEPGVAALVEPLEVVRQAAAEVHAPGQRVAREESLSRRAHAPRAPQDVQHRGVVGQVAVHPGVQGGQLALGLGIVAGQVGKEGIAPGARRQRNQQRAGHGVQRLGGRRRHPRGRWRGRR